jgi:hypothetical protein
MKFMEKMCSYSGGSAMIESPKDAPKYIRCPVCGRRLKPRLYDCHYAGVSACWHYGVPPHKVKKWWKKK